MPLQRSNSSLLVKNLFAIDPKFPTHKVLGFLRTDRQTEFWLQGGKTMKEMNKRSCLPLFVLAKRTLILILSKNKKLAKLFLIE